VQVKAYEIPICTINFDGSKSYILRGELHRLDGPAVEFADGGQVWYAYGKLHREDGPAIDYGNGIREWYFDGQFIRYYDANEK